MLFVAIQNVHNHLYFPKNATYHIHRGLTAQNYTDEILKLHVKPHIDNLTLADGTDFMQQGATSHTARSSYRCGNWCPCAASKEFRYQYHLERVVGCVKTYQSCESITEKCRQNATKNAAELKCSVHGEWQNIIQARSRRSVDSTPRRLRAFVESRGGHIYYHWIVGWIFEGLIICAWNLYCAWCILSMRWSMFKNVYWEVNFTQ